MDVLSFDIKGKFAHFRKFHGNNTALSYSIPPRTTIIGMLAAVLGREKDSYYQDFSHKNLGIGIRVLYPIKKSFHRLNFLSIKSRSDFRGTGGRVQTPFELITGYDLKKNMVGYRIYLVQGKNEYPFNQIKEQLQNRKQTFNLSLGIAGFNANIANVQLRDAMEKQAEKEWVTLHSAANSDQISELFFEEDDYSFNHIEEELLPADFEGGDRGRHLAEMNRVLFSTQPVPMEVELTGRYYELSDNNDTENIQFLEYVSVLAQQG